MEWVPINEKWPDKTGLYLVHWKYGYMGTIIFYYNTNNWSVSIKDVTHWMPLPEPPNAPTTE